MASVLNVEGFRALFEAVVPGIRDRGGRVYLAQLGNVLRAVDPEFSPAEYGAMRLMDLLAELPEVGRIERGATSGNVAFVLTGTDCDDGSRNASSLHRDLWNALVDPTPENAAWIDLSSGKLFTLGADVPPRGFEHDPARFLRVPPLDQDVIRGWALEFALAHGAEASAAAGIAKESEERWFPLFIRALPNSLRARWLDLHRERVVRSWTAWARKHQVHPAQGFRTAREERRSVEPVDAPTPRLELPASDTESLRAVVHRAIDLMSRDELLALRIPLHAICKPDE